MIIQGGDLSDDDLVKALSDLGLEMNTGPDEGPDDAAFEPIIQNMMKSLLSKDVLYPSMQRIAEMVSLHSHVVSIFIDYFYHQIFNTISPIT